MGLENITEEGCKEEIKVVAGLFSDSPEKRDYLYKRSVEYFFNQYKSLKEEGKNKILALTESLEKTREYMPKEAKEMYNFNEN